MKQQFVVIHRHAVLQETQKTREILKTPRLKHVVFLRKYEKKQFVVDIRFWQKACL